MLRTESSKFFDGLASVLKEMVLRESITSAKVGRRLLTCRDKTLCYLVMSCYVPLTVIFWLNREKCLSLCGQAECF